MGLCNGRAHSILHALGCQTRDAQDEETQQRINVHMNEDAKGEVGTDYYTVVSDDYTRGESGGATHPARLYMGWWTRRIRMYARTMQPSTCW